MAEWFHVGQKVVCIDDSWPANSWYGHEKLPVLGETYTIREIGRLIDGIDDIGVRLQEIVNPLADYSAGVAEAAFAARRFRPLRERKSDISIFTALLTPHREKERA